MKKEKSKLLFDFKTEKIKSKFHLLALKKKTTMQGLIHESLTCYYPNLFKNEKGQ